MGIQREHSSISSAKKRRLYLDRVGNLLDSLGIGAGSPKLSQLPVHMEAPQLVSIGRDIYQREQQMLPEAASSWLEMKEAAARDQVELQIVSAYRSADYQANIIRRKLRQGQSIEKILSVSAAPGYSEHHTGRAIDITTPDSPVLEESFENSEAFDWLTRHAGRFDFRLSYPRGNKFGVIYEPWHWAWTGSAGISDDPELIDV